MLSANLVLIILLWKNRKISVHIYWSVKSFGNCAAFTRSSISITGNQSVSLRSFALFRSAVPVGRRQKKPPPSVPQSTRQHSVGQPRKKGRPPLRFLALIFTRSLPAFGGATTSTIQLHSVTLRKLRSTAFQHYYVCRPLFFQRLLLSSAIGVGSVR